MNLSELRAVVFGLDGYQCGWPGCYGRPVELAHIHPRGMGGRRSANTIENTFAACSVHARVSDLIPPDGWHWYDVLAEWKHVDGYRIADRRDTLMLHIAAQRQC